LICMIIANYVPSVGVNFLFLKIGWIAPNCVELPRNTPLCAEIRPLAPNCAILNNNMFDTFSLHVLRWSPCLLFFRYIN
jgi:hypothetical protein